MLIPARSYLIVAAKSIKQSDQSPDDDIAPERYAFDIEFPEDARGLGILIPILVNQYEISAGSLFQPQRQPDRFGNQGFG